MWIFPILERLLGFLFTFTNFRTGMFALVLYFLDRYFMAGSSLLGVPSYGQWLFTFKWNSAVGIYLYERMKMHKAGNGTEYLRACQPVRFWLSFWFDVHHFLSSHWKRREWKRTENGFTALCFHMWKMLWKEMGKACWIFGCAFKEEQRWVKRYTMKEGRNWWLLLKHIFAV